MRYTPRLTLLAALLVGGAATPAGAQVARDTVERRVLTQVRMQQASEDEIQRIAVEIAAKRAQMETLRMRHLQERSADARMAREIELRLNELARTTVTLRQKLEELCRTQPRPAGWLGATFDVTVSQAGDAPVVAKFERYPTIVSVDPASPAARAGLEAGDQLIAASARDLREIETSEFGSLLKPGVRLPLRIRRAGENRDVSVLITPRPTGAGGGCQWMDQPVALALIDAPMAPGETRGFLIRTQARTTVPSDSARVRALGSGGRGAVVAPVPAMSSVVTGGPTTLTIVGAQLAAMSAELREALGATRGILVLNVVPESPAASAGLKGGDVITEADGILLTTPVGFQRQVWTDPDGEVKLQVVRKQKALTVTLRWKQ